VELEKNRMNALEAYRALREYDSLAEETQANQVEDEVEAERLAHRKEVLKKIHAQIHRT